MTHFLGKFLVAGLVLLLASLQRLEVCFFATNTLSECSYVVHICIAIQMEGVEGDAKASLSLERARLHALNLLVLSR